MSCRTSPGSSAAVSIAKTRSGGLDDAQIQSVFHRLKREGTATKAPTRAELVEWAEREAFVVRNDQFLTDATKDRILDRLAEAAEDNAKLPDGPAFHAMQRISTEAAAARVELVRLAATPRFYAEDIDSATHQVRFGQWRQASQDKSLSAPEAWRTTFKGGDADRIPGDKATLYAFWRAEQAAEEHRQDADRTG